MYPPALRSRWTPRPCVAALGLAFALAGPLPESSAAEVVFTETEFEPASFTRTDFQFGSGGYSTLTQEPAGGESGAFGQIVIHLNAADAASPAVYAAYIKNTAVYDPSVSGAIERLDWTEYANQILGFRMGQRSGPALEQGGVVYLAELASNPVFTPENTWTAKGRRGLTAADFAVITGGGQPPDFSATGAPIRFGFFRANSGTPFQDGGDGPVVGIDSWSIAVNSPGYFDEIRARTEISGTPAAGPPTTATSEQFIPSPAVTDRVDATSLRFAPGGPANGSGSSSARAAPAGLGCRSESAAGVFGGESIRTSAKASWRRKLRLLSTGPATTAGLDVVNFADGALDLVNTLTDNPSAPDGSSLWASVALDVTLLTDGAGSVNVFHAEALLSFDAPSESPVLDRNGTTVFRDAFTLRTALSAPSAPYASVDYFEVIPDLVQVNVEEDFAVEYSISTETNAGLAASGWIARSNFYDTFGVELSTDTPGVTLVEDLSPPSVPRPRTRLAGKLVSSVKSARKLSSESEWALRITGGAWSATTPEGLVVRGVATPTGKTGRAFALLPDAASVSAILATVADAHAAQGVVLTSLQWAPNATPHATYSLNRKRTKAKFALKLPFTASRDGTVAKGIWSIRLGGPPAE